MRIAELEQERQISVEIIRRSPVMISVMRAPDFTYESVNPAFQSLAPGKEFVGRRFADAWAEVAEPLVPILENVIETGRAFQLEDAPYTIRRGPGGEPELIYVSYSWIPVPGPDGKPDRVLTLAHETTAEVRQRQELSGLNESLKESEERAAFALETTGVAAWDLDLVDLTAHRSSSHDRIFGYESLPRPWTFEIFLEHVVPEDREEVRRKLAESAGTGADWSFECRIRRADGAVRWIWAAGRHRRDPGGELRRMSGVVQDITERKESEQRLRESEQVYRAIGESIDYGVWMCSPDGRNTYASESFLKLVGLTQEQCSSFGWGEVLHPDDAEQTIAAWKECVRTEGRWEIEHRFRGVDGRWHPILARGVPVRDEQGRITCWAGINLDISALKRAEEAVRESEVQFRTLANAIPQLCWIADAEGGLLWYNQRWYDYTGTTPEQMAGWGWQSVHDPEVLPMVLERWRESIATGEPLDIVFPLRRADGVFRPFLTRVMPVRGPEGKVVRWFGTNTDIGEQRRAEEALREERARLQQSEERLRLAQTRGAVGVWDWDPRTGALHFTPELEQLYGLAPGRIKTYEDWRRLAHPDDIAKLEAERDVAVARGEQFDLEFRIFHASGEIRWLSARGGAMYDEAGAAVRVLGVNVDITRRKRAEEALAEAIQRLDAHMDNSPLAVIEFDPQFRVTRWSKEAERVFGWRADEVLGRRIAELRWVHDDEVQAVAQVSQDMLSGALPRNFRMNRNYRKDGSTVECEWYNSAIYDAEGKLTSILSQVLDVTDRRRSEELLRESQKLESLGLLAGGVAHDFNNLLVGVVGNASLAQDMLPADHPVHPLLAGVLKAGEQAAHLTRQMLAYSGKGRFLVELLDLTALIPEMTGLVSPSIPKKVVLRLDLQMNLPAVEADRGQVQQVFTNLILNAAEAIGNHEGLISVTTGIREIDEQYPRLHPEIGSLASGKYVCLEVSDTGCGIDDATKARIFDPFFSTKFIGRGLGLAAVAGIVRGHKGAITVRSSPGGGSCFTVLFPAAARPAVTPPVVTPNAALQGSGTVLVVDDEPMVRDLAKHALEGHGYTVLVADGGLAALDIARRHPGALGLIVLDLSMPHMSGEEVLPEIRKIRPDVKVLVSSGYSESEVMRSFDGQRVSGFIQKPYPVKSLLEKVRDCLEQ